MTAPTNDPKTQQQRVQEILRCGKDPAYFIKRYAKIQHALRGTIPFETYPFQDDCLRDFEEHRLNIVLKSRQLGLSTLVAAYATWLAIFYKDKNILIIATKLPTAMNFIKKVKVILQNMPSWMLLTKFDLTKQAINFGNGSSITAIPTSEDAGRSEALSLLIVDECVDGSTVVDVRDRFTGEEMSITMRDLHRLLQFEKQDVSYVYMVDDDNLDEEIGV